MNINKELSREFFVPLAHQKEDAETWHDRKRLLNFSECGTGKTLSCIYAVKTYWKDARVLVLAPLSILEPAWKKDLALGWPKASVAVAYASNRKKAFEAKAQWTLTNHDAVRTIVAEGWGKDFDVLIVDEADVFRNRTSQRSKSAQQLANQIPIITLMTGTPTPNSVLDVWNLAFMADGGERLGKNFFGFRQQVCTPQAIPGVMNAMKWEDKAMANDLVTSMLMDITIRKQLNEVQELPDIITRTVTITLPKKIRAPYEFLKKESMLQLQNGEMINAVHAGARMQKMLQLLSGAVYAEDGSVKDMHTDRHKLVMDLATESTQCLVAFNWHHQKTGLIAEAEKRKISYEVIDGGVSARKRVQIVRDFQNGKFKVLIAHPQSAGHGLTLTNANRVIWASPTYRADLYEQFNHRIYRTGQKQKTEIIHIASDKTAEQEVYNKLMSKKSKMDDLLKTLVELTGAA